MRLDPNEDKAVTRGVHAKLVRNDSGGWELECLHASGVGVVGSNDQVVRRLGQAERMPVQNGQVFEIGNGGPHLRVDDPNAPMARTETKDTGGAPVPFTPRDVIGKARTSARRIKAMAVVGLIAIVGVTAGIIAVNRSSTGQIAGARAEAIERVQGVRQETLQGLSELRKLTATQASALESQLADVKGEIARVEEATVDRMDTVLAKRGRHDFQNPTKRRKAL